MPIPLILMAAGTAMSMIGQWTSNWEQAAAERRNAEFYRKQAEYARLAAMRAEQLAEFDYSGKIGQQTGAYAASGVDLSGSAAVTVGGSIKNMIDEIWAIKKKGDMDVQLAQMRGTNSQQRADMLSSTGYNVMQGAGTLLNAYTASEGFGQGFPSWMQPSGTLPSNSSGTLRYFPSASTSGSGLSSYNA